MVTAFSVYNQQTSESRIKIVFPDLLERIKRLKPQRLLDYGCGPGIFLRDFASQLGIEQVGFDVSAEMIEMATKNCELLKNLTTIVTDLEKLPAASFDTVTTTAVWMCWKTDEDCVANLRAMRRLIKDQGRLYAVVTHPAFRDEVYSTCSFHLDNADYLSAGHPFEVNIWDQDKKCRFLDYHWPLSSMCSQLKSAGFRIDELKEYPDTTETTKGSPWLLTVACPC